MTAPAPGSEGAPQGDPAGASTPPEGAPSGDAAPEGDKPLGPNGEKALQAERDARAAAEAKVKEFEKAQQEAERAKLSADERAALERKEANERAETAERELARLRVVVDKKIPAEFADRLVGSTVEELAADADKLLASLAALTGQAAAPPPPGGKANEALPRGGGDPTNAPTETDPAKLAGLVPRRY